MMYFIIKKNKIVSGSDVKTNIALDEKLIESKRDIPFKNAILEDSKVFDNRIIRKAEQ